MTLTDGAGLAGVALIVAAYASTSLGRLDPRNWPALGANFVGASLILVSLSRNFNLSATVMEVVWALVALIGLIRLTLVRR
jgi:hypothetical protein